jgi:hypothetical protein
LEQNTLSAGTRLALAGWIDLQGTIYRFHCRGDRGTLLAIGLDLSLGQLVESGLRPCNPEHLSFSR